MDRKRKKTVFTAMKEGLSPKTPDSPPNSKLQTRKTTGKGQKRNDSARQEFLLLQEKRKDRIVGKGEGRRFSQARRREFTRKRKRKNRGDGNRQRGPPIF